MKGVFAGITLFSCLTAETLASDPHYGDFSDGGCDGDKRKWSAILWDIEGDWKTACEAHVAKRWNRAADKCVEAGFHMWGEFFVPDKTCGYVFSGRSNPQQVPDWQKGGTQDFADFKDFWLKLDRASVEVGELKNMTGAHHSETRFEAWSHVQGMAWGIDDNGDDIWAINHDTGGTKSLLVIHHDDVSRHYPLGDDPHPGGGMQIVGKVLTYSDSGTNTRFYDIRDPDNIQEMDCRINDDGGSVALAWHPVLQRHITIVGSGGSADLYVSNGFSLDSEQCTWERVDKFTGKTGEGLSQLYYVDNAPGGNDLLVVSGVKTKFYYTTFELSKDHQGNWTKDENQEVSTDLPADAGTTRWGATLRNVPLTGFELITGDKGLFTADGRFTYKRIRGL